MTKGLTFPFFGKKIKTVTQTTVPITTVGALLIMTIILTGTTTTNVVNVWAGTFPGPNGQIAFVSLTDGNDEIYVMNADGSGLTRLTDDPADDFNPSWSPDGEKIAFGSFRDSNEESNNEEIYVMSADDGSGLTRLTDDPAIDTFANWSPDGEKIAFTSDRDNSIDEIYVMNADDGSDVTRLTDNDADDLAPSWSPDGERIAFASDRDENATHEIYVMNADDGSGQTRLTNNDADDFNPSWSPDGEKIAFSGSRDNNEESGSNFDIF